MSTPGDKHRLCIAVAQPLVVPGNVQENLARMVPMVTRAAADGADLVLFSECSLTGYDLKNVGVKAAIPASGAAISTVSEMARQYDLAIVVGFHESDANSIYNSVAICLPDGNTTIQRKHALSPHEKANTPVRAGARRRHLVTYRGHQMAALICFDHGIEGIYAELATQGCTLVLGSTAGCGTDARGFHQAELGDPARLEAYLEAAKSACFVSPHVPIEHRFAIAWCNQAGYDPSLGYFHPGHGAVIDHTGEITALIPGRFVFEHLRPDLALGFVTRSPAASPALRARQDLLTCVK